MKTDLSGSTARFRALAEADLHTLLVEHRAFLGRQAAAHDGRIVKPEGDGFWLVFPSVTAAALAAMAMQEELRLAQSNRGDDRLVMRVVITLGDVLHEEGGSPRGDHSARRDLPLRRRLAHREPGRDPHRVRRRASSRRTAPA